MHMGIFLVYERTLYPTARRRMTNQCEESTQYGPQHGSPELKRDKCHKLHSFSCLSKVGTIVRFPTVIGQPHNRCAASSSADSMFI